MYFINRCEGSLKTLNVSLSFFTPVPAANWHFNYKADLKKCLSKLYGNNSIIGTYNLYLLNIYSFQEAELMFNVRWWHACTFQMLICFSKMNNI